MASFIKSFTKSEITVVIAFHKTLGQSLCHFQFCQTKKRLTSKPLGSFRAAGHKTHNKTPQDSISGHSDKIPEPSFQNLLNPELRVLLLPFGDGDSKNPVLYLHLELLSNGIRRQSEPFKYPTRDARHCDIFRH